MAKLEEITAKLSPEKEIGQRRPTNKQAVLYTILVELAIVGVVYMAAWGRQDSIARAYNQCQTIVNKEEVINTGAGSYSCRQIKEEYYRHLNCSFKLGDACFIF